MICENCGSETVESCTESDVYLCESCGSVFDYSDDWYIYGDSFDNEYEMILSGGFI